MKQTKVVLIFPACNTKTFGSNEAGGSRMERAVTPPLGILYLGAELMQAGFDVDACDYNAERYSDESLAERIRDADVVGVSMMTFNRAHAREIISAVGRLRPEVPVIAGGPDCILHGRLVPGTCATVVHEAERIIVPLVETLVSGGDLAGVPGIICRDGEGHARHGGEFIYTKDLDSLTFPRRELLRDNKGYSVMGPKTSRTVTTMITSRGCPKRCRFCAHGAIAYQRYRERSVDNVLEEFRQIAGQGYKVVGIVDDNFTANRGRARQILEGVRDMRSGLSLVVQGRADAADKQLFRLMKQAGVKLITFGLESGCQDVLDFYDKKTTVAQNARAIRLADRAGLYTAGLFIIGAPFETRKHFEKTYRFAARLPLDVTSFWVLDYTYGSRLWEEARARGQIAAYEHNVPAGRERGTSRYSTEYLEKAAERMFFRYYRRPWYWVRQVGKLLRTRDRYFLSILIVGGHWLVRRKTAIAARKIAGRLRLVCQRRRLWRPGAPRLKRAPRARAGWEAGV